MVTIAFGLKNKASFLLPSPLSEESTPYIDAEFEWHVHSIILAYPFRLEPR